MNETPRPTNLEAAFEISVDAIVRGDEATLNRLLRENPDLVHARSSRQHRATLLHYLGANGVEDDRQKTPPNAIALLNLLLQAGSEVDAIADVYSGSTTLGLVATSAHPQKAGLQIPLMERLLEAGANIGLQDPSLIRACLANYRPVAAEFLASRGVPLDLASAAGLGHLEQVRDILQSPSAKPDPNEQNQAFIWACAYSHESVALYLLNQGTNIFLQDQHGQTGLHHAAMHANPAMVKVLIDHGAPLEAINSYGGTVLGQALWSAAHSEDPETYLPTIQILLAAGASKFFLGKSTAQPTLEFLRDSLVAPLPDSILLLLMDSSPVG